MSAMRAATSGEKAYLRTEGQRSQLFIAGLVTPPTVFAAQVDQVIWDNYDKIISVPWKNATIGTYTDIVGGMTLWVGDTPGGRERGEIRVRSADATTLWIGEESDIEWTDNLYLTIKDEFLLWPRHVNTDSAGVVYMDNSIVYSDQHENFDPVPVMGPDVVLDVTAYPVSVTFPECVDSWVHGSTISGYHFYSNAGGWTNPTTSGASLAISSYPANGLIRVWLTVTAANGKTMTGYRYIYVYDADHRPEHVFTVGNINVDYDAGGWSFDATMFGDISAVRDRAKVILFRKDYYGNTQVSLGQVDGRENIEAVGYVNSESIEYDAEKSQVTFNVQGPQFWLGKMSGFPPGVEI